MIAFNQVTFIGNAGKDPELQTSANGTPVCRFSLAVSTYAGKDEQGKAKTVPMWLTVDCWKDLAAQVRQAVTKGALVLVAGRLSVRTYTDKANKEQTAVAVVATTVQVLVSKAKQPPLPEDQPEAA
jgi:single-strand DNA-binding protein